MAAALIVLGESAAIVLGSPVIALATVVMFGGAFAVITWYGPPLAIMGLVVALPLVTVEVGLGDVERTISTDKAALAAVTAVWLLRYARGVGRALLEGAPAKWWMAFIGAVILSGLGNGVTVGQAWGVLEQAVYAAVFLMTFYQLSVPAARATVKAAGLTAGAVGFVALVEWAAWRGGWPVVLYFKQGTARDDLLGATIAHTNFLGGYLVLLLPTLVVLLATGDGMRRAATLAAAAAAGGLVYARSVGAWAGRVGASLTFVAVAASRWPRRLRWASVGIVLALVVVTLTVTVLKMRSGSVSFGVRAATYRIGMAAIGERPLLGFGTNGYAHHSPRLEQAVYGRVLTELHPSTEPLTAHSSFVDVAVERGLLGLVAFTGLLASLLAAGVHGYRQIIDPPTRMMVLGIMAGLVGFGLQAATENLFSYSKIAAVFWILAAALVRLDDGPRARGTDPPCPSSPGPRQA